MKNTLLAVAGSRPQIISETIWYLANAGDDAVHFDAVHIATTETVRPRIEQLTGENGVLARLAADIGAPVPKVEVHVFSDDDDRPLADIRSASDSDAFGTGIANLVRRLTMNPDTMLVASIAGGRKTMGVLLSQAMSLFGRPQDRLSHVLVSPEFESADDFWYPTQDEAVTGRDGDTLDPASAKVEVTDIQFVRLRGRLTAQDLQSSLPSPRPLIDKAQAAIDSREFVSSTTLELTGIVDPNAMTTDPLPRPLAKIARALGPGELLTLRVTSDPGRLPSLRIFFDCVGRGQTKDAAMEALGSLVANIGYILDLARNGYRVVPATEGFEPLTGPHLIRLSPTPTSLYIDEDEKLGAVTESSRKRGVRMGGKHIPDVHGLARISAIATFGSPVSLSWAVEKITLDDSQVAAVENIQHKLIHASTNASGDIKFDKSTLIRKKDADYLCASLERWLHVKHGLRCTLSIASEKRLPSAMIKGFGYHAWSGRPFDVIDESAVGPLDPGVVELADAFSDEHAIPFELPSRNELLDAGISMVYSLAPSGLSKDGVILGHAGSRPIRLGDNDRAMHTYIIGGSGTGKSTLLRNMLVQDIEEGKSVFVLDPHGDLVDDVLEQMPQSRSEDVILLNAGDIDHPFSINFLETDPDQPELSSGFIINELLSIVMQLYPGNPEAFGPMFEQYFRNALLIVLNNAALPSPTIQDFVRLFNDSRYRRHLLKSISDEAVGDAVRAAMQASGEASWENIAPYITSKLTRFARDPLMRNLSCQVRSSIDFKDVLRSPSVTLVKLPKGRIDELNVRMLGMLIVGKLFGAAMHRPESEDGPPAPTNVYIDEAQNFATQSFEVIMAEARKFGLRMTLANQNLAQVNPRTRDTILGNAANLISFRLGPIDANLMKPYFSPSIDQETLQALPNFHSAARILNDGAPIRPPFVLESEYPRETGGPRVSVELMVEASRLKYGRPRAKVEEAIKQARADTVEKDSSDKTP